MIKIKTIIVLLLTFISSVLNAAPNIQDVMTIDGVKILRDHQHKNIFYYLKAEKKLLLNADKPDFQYIINRYIGTEITDDSSAFWVRGVVKFQTVSAFTNTSYQQIKDKLSQQYGRKVKLRAAPVQKSYNKLTYVVINSEDDKDIRGEIEGGLVTQETQKKRVFGSNKQRFTIGLQAHDANLFWENFENNNLQLSLAYGWQISGVAIDEEDQWYESVYQVDNTMPINVSPRVYPQLFHKNELWQNVRFANSKIKVMCYDFINIANSPLYYVMVEVRFTTLRNQHYIEKLKFTANSDEYEKDIEFKLVNDLKEGYEYRVRRLNIEGDIVQTDWQKSKSQLLDVSLPIEEIPSQNNIEGDGSL
jgi:hypothetical protein